MTHRNVASDRCQEHVQLAVQVLLLDPQVPVQQEQQLLLHQVDLCPAEAEVLVVVADDAVVGPVLVLGRAVVEVLGGQDQAGQEDAVSRASQSLGHGLKF